MVDGRVDTTGWLAVAKPAVRMLDHALDMS
jgi:hypothetical protein